MLAWWIYAIISLRVSGLHSETSSLQRALLHREIYTTAGIRSNSRALHCNSNICLYWYGNLEAQIEGMLNLSLVLEGQWFVSRTLKSGFLFKTPHS